MEIVEGFVIRCSKYKDNDAILNIINNQGVDSIIVRGAYSKNSKYLKYAKTFYLGRFETYRGNYAHKKLKDVEVIKDYNLLFLDFDKIVYLQFFQEFFLKIFNEDDTSIFYKLLVLCLDKINKTRQYDKYTYLFLGYALKISGYGINVDSFNDAISEDYALSLSEGKIITSNDKSSDLIALTKDEASSLLSVFTNKFIIAEKSLENKTIDYKKLIKAISLFYEYYSDTKIISLNLL